MTGDLEQAIKSSNALERATVTKSFKYAASKETDSADLENSIEVLLKSI